MYPYVTAKDGAFMEPRACNRSQPVANGVTRETVAVGCDRLPIGSHGKEGVDGSSPSEGSAKAPEIGAFSFRRTCSTLNVRWVWSRLWSFPTATDESGASRGSLPITRIEERRRP
jgi:hypothetical protein